MYTEFSELVEELKTFYKDNFLGLIVFEVYEEDIIGMIIILRERSPILIDDSLRALRFIKYYFPDAKSISAMSIDDLKEKVEKKEEGLLKFVKNIVYVYDATGEINNLLKKITEDE